MSDDICPRCGRRNASIDETIDMLSAVVWQLLRRQSRRVVPTDRCYTRGLRERDEQMLPKLGLRDETCEPPA